MGKSTTTSNNILKLIFNAADWANMAINATASPLTNLYVALHTGDPGVGGTQSTAETAYTNYVRVAVARTAGGWVASTAASTGPVAAVNFAACGATGSTITHASVGVASGGATTILYSGAVTPNLTVSTGVAPQITTASTITES